MHRREFFSLAAMGATIRPQISVAKQANGMDSLLEDLKVAIRAEMPGVTRIEVECRPEDPKMPLMIFAFRD